MGTETLIETFITLQQKLLRMARRILRDEMEAEDAVQDTFCNLWACSVPQTPIEAGNKLYAVLKNVCLNKLKRKRPVTGLELPEVSVSDQPIDEIDKTLALLMASMTPLQRDVFRMSVFEDMEYEEIAQNLSLSVDTVRMHMCRARKRLKEQYKKIR